MRPPGNGRAFLYALTGRAAWCPVGGGPPARSPHASLRLGVVDLEARLGPAIAHGHRSLALGCCLLPSPGCQSLISHAILLRVFQVLKSDR